jgi:ABC-type multidrug transport system permease subunit
MVELTLTKIRELVREPEALFWVFVFPILLALALGVAFRSGSGEEIRVAVQPGDDAQWIVQTLTDASGLRAEAMEPEPARLALRKGAVALVVLPGEPWTYWFDPTRPESRLARLSVDDALQTAAGRRSVHPTIDLELTELGSRYIDFLVPGLLGMNLMGTGMWGIGFYIVNARSKGLLKRLTATPMKKREYLLSQLTGRLIFLVPEVVALLVFAVLVFQVPLRGSWVDLSVVCVLGAMAFSGLGLLVASRIRTIEGVSGLMNFVMMPMWIMSGTFFSTARFPDWLQPVVQLLPLTAVNDALRQVMIDGATLIQLSGELTIIAGWGSVTFVVALWSFRWN